MIERLSITLDALSRLSPVELVAPASENIRRDCADALRLELDCRQLEMSAAAREVLLHLSDLLEGDSASGDELANAIHAARVTAAASRGAP